MPLEDRARIFEAFYTGRAPGGHVRGTGIGLSVVNEFVNVHQGTVEIVDGEVPGRAFPHPHAAARGAADAGQEAGRCSVDASVRA